MVGSEQCLSSSVFVLFKDGGGGKDAGQQGCKGLESPFFSPALVCGAGVVNPPMSPAFVFLRG